MAICICRPLAVAIAFALESICGSAWSQESTLTLRLLPSPEEATQIKLLRRLDEIAKPVQITPNSPGSIKEVILRRCGFISSALEEGARNYNPGLDFGENLKGKPITLPACPYWRFNVPVDISAISTVSRTALAATGLVGNKTLGALIERNPRLLNQSGKKRVARGSLILPYETRPFTLVLRPKYSNSKETAMMLAREFPSLLKPTYVENYVDGAAKLMFVIDPIVGGGQGNCRGRAEDWPFNSDAIADALEKNALARNSSITFAGGTVLIADTGLTELDLTKLPMRRNQDEGGPNAIEGVDDDSNGYTDDVFGANMSLRSGIPTAQTNYTDSGHGTQVASMVFGPWMNARLQAVIRSRMGISAANIVQEDVVGLQEDGAPKLWVHVPPSNVERAFTYADWMQPKPILNVSFKSDQPFPPLTSLLRSAPYLVVVAVGNDGRPIDKAQNERYPAEYRRAFEGQILSVAAHDGNNRLANFSNYGPEVVDIAAPGCELKTKDIGGDVVISSGTSLAAPLVSLTAALLYSEGIFEPSKIKDRIVSASHFVPDLRAVASSGRLDMVMALRIYSDIVVLKAKPPKPQETLFGRITNQEVRVCGDVLNWRAIASVIPRFYDAPTGTSTRILVRKSGRLTERRCDAPPELRFSFNDERGGPPMLLSFDDIDQLITAIR